MKIELERIFDDLDQFRDYCRFNGKVFNEADLYKNSSDSWRAYQVYTRSKGRPRQTRDNRYKR